MVDPIQLSFDIVDNTVSLALPGVLWAGLFLLAWEHGPFAESIGLGRWAFWLLLPGALLASFAFLPLAPISDDWLAVSFGGAVFPLLIGALALGRAAPPARGTVSRYLVFLAVESATLLVLVLPVSQPIGGRLLGGVSSAGALDLAVALVAAGWSVAALLLFRSVTPADSPAGASGSARVVGFTLVLTSAVLATTFAASAAIPGVGIVEDFPVYLIPPIGAGLVAVLFAPQVFPGREAFALPSAYFATTVGVLLGADLLRQPPLYGSGPAGLYTIGGAGVLDLVYLSGLLALGAAVLGHRALGRRLDAPRPSPDAPAPTPLGLLGRSFREGVRGQLGESVQSAAHAGRSAATQAHRLLGLPPAPPDHPWQGLPVPGWVMVDQANLDALARAGTADSREGFRAWLTARWLVYIGRDLGLRRFATLGSRAIGFLVDAAVLLLPAIGVWCLLAVVTPGGLDALLSNIGYNAAVYGFVAVGFLYLVVSETWTGASLGMRVSRVMVRDRRMRVPDLSAALVRNAPLLPILTVLGFGGAIGVAFLLKPTAVGAVTLAGLSFSAGVLSAVIVLALVIGGVLLLGSIGAVVIAFTSERQRVGDLWAGTWVVRAPSPVPPTSAPPGAAGVGRSG